MFLLIILHIEDLFESLGITEFTEAITAFPRERVAEWDENDGGAAQGTQVESPPGVPFFRGKTWPSCHELFMSTT